MFRTSERPSGAHGVAGWIEPFLSKTGSASQPFRPHNLAVNRSFPTSPLPMGLHFRRRFHAVMEHAAGDADRACTSASQLDAFWPRHCDELIEFGTGAPNDFAMARQIRARMANSGFIRLVCRGNSGSLIWTSGYDLSNDNVAHYIFGNKVCSRSKLCDQPSLMPIFFIALTTAADSKRARIGELGFSARVLSNVMVMTLFDDRLVGDLSRAGFATKVMPLQRAIRSDR